MNPIKATGQIIGMVAAFTYVMGVKVLWLPVWAVQRALGKK